LCTYRNILRISWTENVTNVKVIRRTGMGVEILHEVEGGLLGREGYPDLVTYENGSASHPPTYLKPQFPK